MQIMFELGVEHGERTAGVGVLPGTVTRLEAEVVPHMGWNTVEPPEGSALFAGLVGSGSTSSTPTPPATRCPAR